MQAPKATERMMGVGDLASRLRFAFDAGHIWLGESRMLLLHGAALSALRKELIDSLGVDRARGMLLRIGYASGARDAELARKLYPKATVASRHKSATRSRHIPATWSGAEGHLEGPARRAAHAHFRPGAQRLSPGPARRERRKDRPIGPVLLVPKPIFIVK